jgi:DNA-binding transcriptional LysR family regulator
MNKGSEGGVFGLRHLQAFVAACDERHVGRAAGRLNLTQPAVSKTLSELEAIAGHKLLQRGRLGTRPTPRGEAFLNHARQVVDAVIAARAALADHPPVQPVVRLGILPTVAPSLAPPVIELFQAQHPSVGVVIVTRTNAELLNQLREGLVDLAVGRMSDPAATSGLTFEVLYLDGLSIAMRPEHPLSGFTSVSLVQALAFPLVVCSAGSAPHRNTEALFGIHGLKLPTNCIETLDVAVATEIVKGSDALWIAPASTVRRITALEGRSVSGADRTGIEAVGLFQLIGARASRETETLAGCIRQAPRPS